MHYVRRYVGYVIVLVIVGFIALYFSRCAATHLPVDHDQMSPTFKPDDWAMLHKSGRDPSTVAAGLVGYEPLERGDVVRFAYGYPSYDSDEEVFMGRILAMEGERVAIRKGDVYWAPVGAERINFDKNRVSESHLSKDLLDPNLHFHEIVVPRGHVFLLTDNRKAVERKNVKLYKIDSRFLGPIPTSLIVGKLTKLLGD
ncbi:MAG: signal peptidase I [Planctomycetes bacterium]|nr:signal peptidase I [Planctomycetota bacterium]